MKLDLGSFMFNVNVTNGGTPSWGTALGQNTMYKFDINKIKLDFFSSMLYKSVSNEKVICSFGKGGNSVNYEIILSSVFDKVFVNGDRIKDAEFLLIIVKEHSQSHNGRKNLKYVPSAKYDNKNINFECLNLIKKHFNLSEDTAWIITNIDFKNQDELHFTMYKLNDEHIFFDNANVRKDWINNKINELDSNKNTSLIENLKQDYLYISKKIPLESDTIKCFSIKHVNELDDLIVDSLINELKLSNKAKDSFKNGIKIGRYLDEEKNNLVKSCSYGESFDYKCSNKDGTNLIVYGTPGCGKSHYVEHTLLKNYRHNEEGLCIDAIRTTFYQDYTNTDFVGQIMPVVNGDKVTYEFNPGPFALALNKAIQNPDLPVALVIEELNRGNAASIFGDIFQLLDRENGISVYNITNVNIQKYLQEQNPDYLFEYIKLPSNLSIFATMNTSDQNVFTLDTAFKRRWKFEKLKNTFDKHSYATKLIPGMDLDWKEFCTAINNFIIESKDEITNSEDKQLGVYFIDEKGLRIENVSSDEVQRKEFAYKIFEYLWDDVVKYDRTALFKDANTLDELIDNYVKSGSNDIDGKNVFVDNIFKKNGN